MFCPNCNAYLQEDHLIKKNMKKFDNAVIEYDARCPACNEEIGHMFWGVFTPAEHLQPQAEHPSAPPPLQEAPPPESPKMPPAPPQQQQESAASKDIHLSWPQPPESEVCTCPHCGKPLPKEYKKSNPTGGA